MLNSNSGVKTACLASLVKTFNVIYLIQCRLCNLQYIGETKRRLKDRFNERRRPILNPTRNYIHNAISEHLLTRKAREAHLIHKAKTIKPLGINKRDEL